MIATKKNISSTLGKIDKLLLFLNYNDKEADFKSRLLFKNIVTAFGDGITYYCCAVPNLSPFNEDDFRNSLIDAAGIPGLKIEVELGCENIWVQDTFELTYDVDDSGEEVLHLIYTDAGASCVPSLKNLFGNNIQERYTTFPVLGNNLIISGDASKGKEFLLVSGEMVETSKHTDLNEELKRLFGIDRIISLDLNFSDITDKRLCDHLLHLDMYVTAGGSYNGRELLLVGNLTGVAISAANEARFNELKEMLDRVAVQLKGVMNGDQPMFEVVRIPLLMVEVSKPEQRYYLSYNNAHVEITNEKRTIYLPSYVPSGIETTPAGLKNFRGYKIVEERAHEYQPIEIELQLDLLDYFDEVKIVPDLHTFAAKKGGLHCGSKVIHRS